MLRCLFYLTNCGKVRKLKSAKCNVHTQRKDYRHEKKCPKEVCPHCRHTGGSFFENSDVSLSAEMEAATISTQKGNIMAECSEYSHPWAHLKFEDRESLKTANVRARHGITVSGRSPAAFPFWPLQRHTASRGRFGDVSCKGMPRAQF